MSFLWISVEQFKYLEILTRVTQGRALRASIVGPQLDFPNFEQERTATQQVPVKINLPSNRKSSSGPEKTSKNCSSWRI